jgi:hypothetical protein
LFDWLNCFFTFNLLSDSDRLGFLSVCFRLGRSDVLLLQDVVSYSATARVSSRFPANLDAGIVGGNELEVLWRDWALLNLNINGLFILAVFVAMLNFVSAIMSLSIAIGD